LLFNEAHDIAPELLGIKAHPEVLDAKDAARVD
jgi:hypothetical protein